MTTLTLLRLIAGTVSVVLMVAFCLAFAPGVPTRRQDFLMAWIVLPCLAVLFAGLVWGWFL